MNSPTYGDVTNSEMFDLITKYINSDKYGKFEITVGADSQSFKRRTKYVLVIAVRNVGKGGIFFYDVNWFDKPDTLQTKIYNEVQISLDMAEEVNRYVRELNRENVIFAHIDIDIGTNGETKQFVKSIRGWVEAIGDVPFIIKGQKINQIASCIADRISK